jgi:hypothetical protein
MKHSVIGITGFARSGKDTLANIIKEKMTMLGARCQIFSLAHALKSDLNDFCLDKFGISAFTEHTESKSKIRPILIAYGKAKRDTSNGRYWVDKIKVEIESFFGRGGNIAIVPDIRFKEYDFDEYDFIRSYENNALIYVSRRLGDGSKIQAAHESEKENEPFLFESSDAHLDWRSNLTSQELASHASTVIDLIKSKTL